MTLSEAQAQLAAWEAASLAVASGQEHRIGDRMIRLADSAEVRSWVAYWTRRVNALLAGQVPGGSAAYAVATFGDDC